MTKQQSKPKQLRITLANSLAELPRFNATVQAFLESHATPPAGIFAAHLVIEEMVTNIIKYGYDDSLSHEMTVTLTRDPGQLTIRIEDDGHEFNPLTAPPPDTSPQLEKRKIGGLGIHLVRNTVNAIEYHRLANRNILEMTIRL